MHHATRFHPDELADQRHLSAPAFDTKGGWHPDNYSYDARDHEDHSGGIVWLLAALLAMMALFGAYLAVSHALLLSERPAVCEGRPVLECPAALEMRP